MTQLCINCNAPDVRRTGDRFVCRKCGYRWDVAHEQANAAYLASQGRQPAEVSAPAIEAASPPAVTISRTATGPEPSEVVETGAPAGDDEAGQDLLDWLNAHTKAELVALAEEYGVELAPDLRKADMINTLAAVMYPGAAG